MRTAPTYKCLIVDDEALARQLIRAHVAMMSSMEVIGECLSAAEAGQFLKKHKIDLLFLDIHMPQLSGIDFLKSLHDPPKVILTTAYSEFALDGYELNVLDYLLKPITFERFQKAVAKAIEILDLEKDSEEYTSGSVKGDYILVKSSHALVRVNVSDILFIEGLHKYVKIVTRTKNHITLMGLSAMENEISPTKFYRCHRSFIVNLHSIESIAGHHAIIGNHKVPISKASKSELIAKLGRQIV